MGFRRYFVRSVAEASAAFAWGNHPAKGLRVLMYHAVGTLAHGDVSGSFSLSPDSFKRQMIMLSKWKLGHIVDFNEGALTDLNSHISITFDDGYRDNLLVAAPILSQLGLPFTVFITTEFVRKGKAGFLSPLDIRDLALIPRARIGSHSASHIDLTACDDAALTRELNQSKHYLEDATGIEIEAISYPYGRVNTRVRDFAHRAGYKLGACSREGLNSTTSDRMLLARTEISSTDSDRVFLQKLQGHWDWLKWRKTNRE
jgi:peptidoglycan/xylan/chitin deacetylase (PgdA/CDA1 family)